MTKNYITIALCLLLIGVLVAYIFRPADKPEIVGDLSPAQENELKGNLVKSEARGDSLQKELGKREDKDSTQKEGHRTAVAPHKKVIKRLEKDPEVIQIVASLPKIDSLLKAKDSVIVHHEIRMAEQEQSTQVTKEINEQVKHNFEVRIRDSQRLLQDKELETQQMTTENKKLRRRLTLTKIGGVILLGGVIALSL